MGIKICCNIAVALNAIPIIGVFEQICNSSYFWAMVCECGPNFVFLLVVCVIDFVLYLMVEFLK